MAHAMSQSGHAADAHGAHDHPSERVYIKVAGILAVITIVEVAIYYIEMSHALLVTLLLGFSAVKFVTVIGYFMHLKFDDKRLTWIFLGGLIMAVAVFAALHVLQGANPIDYGTDLLVFEQHSETAQ